MLAKGMLGTPKLSLKKKKKKRQKYLLWRKL